MSMWVGNKVCGLQSWDYSVDIARNFSSLTSLAMGSLDDSNAWRCIILEVISSREDIKRLGSYPPLYFANP